MTAMTSSGGQSPRSIHCAPGEVFAHPRPGDFILIRGRGLLGWSIRAAGWIRHHRDEPRYAHWSHAALVLSPNGVLAEMHVRGVGRCAMEKYRGHDFHYVRLDLSDAERDAVVRYALGCLRQRYGVLGFCMLGLAIVLGDAFRIPDRGQNGCVSLIARALGRAGIAFDRAPPDMMPADLAKRFGVLP